MRDSLRAAACQWLELGSAGLSTKQVWAKNAIFPVSSLWALSTGVSAARIYASLIRPVGPNRTGWTRIYKCRQLALSETIILVL